MKLRNKMLLIALGPLSIALTAQTAFSAVMDRRALEEGLTEKARSIARVLVGVVGPNLLFKDAAAAKDGLKFFEPDGDFLFAAALGEDGSALTTVGPATLVERFRTPSPIPAELTIIKSAGELLAIAPVLSRGKVVGAVAIGLSQAKRITAGQQSTLADAALALVSLCCGGLLAWLTAGHILRPVSDTVRVLQAVSAGDLRSRLEVRSSDEIGLMGLALNAALDRVGKTLHGVQTNLDRLTSSANALGEMGSRLGENASSTSSRASGASASAETISGNAATVAAATVQMGSSVREIAGNAADAARVANDAVRSAEATSKSISQLDQSSREIGDVVQLISDIAGRTNLLALNATIEAARAGEAGRGFAVVAIEVKELARQTARATSEITIKVDALQKGIGSTVDSIRAICGVIGEVREYQVAIASAVEQQAQVTRQIGQNAAGAAEASTAIAGNIASLAQTARATATFSEDSQRAAAGLSAIAVELQELVSAFHFAGA